MMPRKASPNRAPLRSIGVLLAILIGCAGSDGGGVIVPVNGNRVPGEQLKRSVTALCSSLQFAARDDLENSRAAFQDLAHDDLHTLAAAIESHDRSAQSRLLRAKNLVESDFSRSDLPALRADFPELILAADTALRLVGIDRDPCPAPS